MLCILLPYLCTLCSTRQNVQCHYWLPPYAYDLKVYVHVDLKPTTVFIGSLWALAPEECLAKSMCCNMLTHICGFLDMCVFGSTVNYWFVISNPPTVESCESNRMLRAPSGRRRKTCSIHATALLKSKLTVYNWNLPHIKVHKFPKNISPP